MQIVGQHLLLSDCQGNLRIIRGLPLLVRAEFRRLGLMLVQMAVAHDLRSLYDSDPLFAQLLHHCLKLNGIEPEWVSIATASRLLIRDPLLIQFNYPIDPPDPDAEEGEPLPEHLDPDAYSLALLWSHTENLDTALHLARTVPWIELYPVIKARSYQLKQLDPKHKEKKSLEQGGDRLTELAKSGALDQLVNSLRSKNGSNIS